MGNADGFGLPLSIDPDQTLLLGDRGNIGDHPVLGKSELGRARLFVNVDSVQDSNGVAREFDPFRIERPSHQVMAHPKPAVDQMSRGEIPGKSGTFEQNFTFSGRKILSLDRRPDGSIRCRFYGGM